MWDQATYELFLAVPSHRPKSKLVAAHLIEIGIGAHVFSVNLIVDKPRNETR
jgi:hypothetical protein